MKTKTEQQQLSNLCRDFLRAQSGRTYNALGAARHMAAWWGVDVDWHEMAYALDHLQQAGQAIRTNKTHDGHQSYLITAGTADPPLTPAQRLQNTDDLAAHLYRQERKRRAPDRELGRRNA